jgi:hypothetical protein
MKDIGQIKERVGDRGDLVVFTLEVNQMRHKIAAGLIDHQATVQREVDKAVSQFIENEAWRPMIHKFVNDQMESVMRGHIQSALWGAMEKNNEVQEMFGRLVSDAVQKAMSGETE